ncbi:MAG: fibronectin type III domain-containing protein, partial [Actinomycetota bacterium]
YAYAACGSFNSPQNMTRIPTSGGSGGAANAGGAPVNGLRIAFSADRTQILQPGIGLSLTGGTSLYRWTVSALSGSGIATTATTTPAFNAPFGVAAGTRAAAPDAPTGTTAVAGNAQATVSWTAPASDGGSALTGYTVTAAPGGGTCTATPPQATCTVTGLTNGTAYTFSVVATNAIGTSAASSASAPVTPSAPAPTPTPTPTPAQANETSGSGSAATPSGGSTPAASTLAVRDVASSNQSASATITSRVVVSGAGSVRQVGTRAIGQSARTIWGARARANAAVLCSASRKTPRAGTYRMTCTLGAGVRAQLERRSIRVRLTTTFTPTGGKAVARSQIVVLKKIPAAAPKVTG